MPRPTKPATPADPLADLRDDPPAGPPVEQPLDTEDQPAVGGPVYDEAWHRDAKAQAVAVYHRDKVAQGILHKGGTCPCAYLAGLALVAAVGDPVEPDDEPAEDEDEDDGTDG